MQDSKPIIWTIAGSDCSGGAGIQADVKTAQMLGAEICTLITANTVQNSQNFVALNPVDVDVLDTQFQALLIDKPPLVLKIGLLATIEQVFWLRDVIVSLRQAVPHLKVVLDPVLKASVMAQNFQLSGHFAFLALLSEVDVITPNSEEALALCEALQLSHFLSHAEALSKVLNTAVIVKGGHLGSANVTDVLVKNGQIYTVQTPRINTSASHGSGCSFATALAVFLAQGFNLEDGLVQVKAFMQAGFKATQGQVQGYNAFQQMSWPVAPDCFPKVRFNHMDVADLSESPVLLEALGVYPVVDSLDWLRVLKPFKLAIIQLRLKNKTSEELTSLIAEAVDLYVDSSTRLIINDYWQLAIEYGADGVHLGQEDLAALSVADWQCLKASGLVLGLSSHGIFEFCWAGRFKPSYIAVGAIFETQTKDMTGKLQGLAGLRSVKNLQSNCPIVAIGGLNLENLPDILTAQVAGIGIVTAISQCTVGDELSVRMDALQALFARHLAI